jgi:hypothetical protein
MDNPGRRRAMDRAADVLRNQPRPRVDPRNAHHLAMPHGANTNRDRVPTPPPPPMMEPEFDPYKDAEGQFAWGRDPDDDEVAAAAWNDDE